MNTADIIVIIIVAAALFFALRSTIRAKKRGGCSGCSGSCEGCPYHSKDGEPKP